MLAQIMPELSHDCSRRLSRRRSGFSRADYPRVAETQEGYEDEHGFYTVRKRAVEYGAADPTASVIANVT